MKRWWTQALGRGRPTRRHRRRSLEPCEPRCLLAGEPLLISEFLATNNATLADEDGTFADWVEVHNPTASPVNLGSWFLTDDPTELTRWQFPPTLLAPGEFLVVFASGKDRAVSGSQLHTNFKLSGGGEFLALVEPDAVTIAAQFAPEFPEQFADVSFGLAPDLATTGYFTEPTPGAANSTTQVSDPSRVVRITEIMYHAPGGDAAAEFIELRNEGLRPVSLAGWKLDAGVQFDLPDLTLAVGEYLVVAADVVRFSALHPGVVNVHGGWTGTLADGGENIQLSDDRGQRVDRVFYADQGDWGQRVRGPLDAGHEGWQWTAVHDGGGKSLERIHPLVTNNSGQNWAASLPDGGTPGAPNSVESTSLAPLISEVLHAPLVPRASDTVTVRARVVDDAPGNLSVLLVSRLDGDPTFGSTQMFDDGAHDDGPAGDGVYAARLPAQADRAVVEFYVQASDADGNLRAFPAANPPTGEHLTNLLYQVDSTFVPDADWIPGSAPVYRLIMTEAERSELADIGDGGGGEEQSDAQMNATFLVLDGTGADVRYNVGVRNRGHGSRFGPPNNYQVLIPHDQPWKGVTAISLNNRNSHSQLIGSAVFQVAGLAANEAQAVELRVNGAEPANRFRTYVAIEATDADFADNHFAGDSAGNIYRGVRLDNGTQQADFRYEGTNPDAYRDTYFKETNQDDDDWTDLIQMTDVLNNAPDATYLQDVSQVINVPQWLRYIALDALLLNRESGLNNGIGDDYGLYRGEIDRRFVLIPHDLDTVFNQGDTTGPADFSIFTVAGVDGLTRFLNHPDVVPLYYQAFLDLIASVFNPQVLDPLIDLALGSFVPAANRAAMKQFVIDRTAGVLQQIPQTYFATSNLPLASGFRRSTSGSAALNGTAHAIETRSVLVHGLPAEFTPRDGRWTTEAGGGTTVSLVPAGASWRYLDNGSNQGTSWRDATFDDSAWNAGPAQLGYGDGDEVTQIEGGPTNNRFITTYFRRTFDVLDAGDVTELTLNLLRDDGAVVYLNGQEIVRDNMPAAPAVIASSTLASSGTTGADESRFFSFTIDPSLLADGPNLLAVEVHQSDAGSSDVSFDLSLEARLASAGGSIPLHPGVNRVWVQYFAGPGGTGPEVHREFVDVWFDDGGVQDVSGTIDVDTTWTPDQGPYRLQGIVTVAPAATLTIAPGTSVYWDTGDQLLVQGALLAQGTDTAPIRFTRPPGSTGVSGGLQFDDSLSDNRLVHAVVEFGGDESLDGLVGLSGSVLTVENVTFDHAERRRIRAQDSSLVVRHSTFTDVFGPLSNGQAPSTDNFSEHIWGGFIRPGGLFLIEHNTFGLLKGHNDGIDFDSDTANFDEIVQIRGNTFLGGGDDALDLVANALIEGNTFLNFRKDQFNLDPGQSNVVSASTGTYTLARNVFRDVQHVALVKEDAFLNFVHNTVSSAALEAIYFDLPGQTSGPGQGALVDGSIFHDVAATFGSLLPTTLLTVDRSVVRTVDLPLGIGNTSEDPRLLDPVAGDVSLRPGSPALVSGPNGLDRGALVPAGASLSGEPPALTAAAAALLTVDGPAITHYRFRLDEGPWSDETPVTVPIALAALPDGSHFVEVVGRDVAGRWQPDDQATRSKTWTVDSTLVRVLINEVLAVNAMALDNAGTFPDAIELFNAGAFPVDLAGWSLTDDEDDPTRFVFPSGTLLAPGEHLVLLADDDTAAPGVHLGFALRGAGDGVFLFAPPAQGGGLHDAVEFGRQLPDLSIGRVGPDQHWALTLPTLGSPNLAQRTGDPATLTINEWLASADVRLAADYIELLNPDPLPVDLAGLSISDNPVPLPSLHTFGPLTFLAGRERARFDADGRVAGGSDHLDFSLSADHELLGLFDPELRPIDTVLYFGQTTDVSQGRAPDGAASYAFYRLPTPDVTNPTSTPPQEILALSSVWRYFQSGDQGTAWVDPAFDDSTWLLGAGVLAAEPDPLPAPINTQLSLGQPTFYFRNHFTLDEVTPATVVALTTLVDDGAVVYVNGVEVTRVRLPAGPISFNTAAAPAVNNATFDAPVTIPNALLNVGDNVIAVEVHQSTITSNDVVFGLRLTRSISQDPAADVALSLLDGLRISEIMYNAPGGPDLEFLELQNISPGPLDLTGARLAGGVEFTFPPLVLGPGEFVVVASHEAAFESRYGTAINLAGEYQGELSNAGEQLLLLPADPYYAAALRFAYDDLWEPTTDGLGHSLVIIDPLARAATWRDANSWQPSAFPLGNPGRDNAAPSLGELSISDVTVVEANSGQQNVVFTLTLSPPSNQQVRVNFATADGTATAGNDYLPRAGVVTFNPNIATRTVTVPVLGDLLSEADETFLLLLSNPQGTTIADGQGRATITDNDPQPALSIGTAVAIEGDAGLSSAVFTLRLSQASGQEVSVDVRTANGTAAAGSDYQALATRATLAPGSLTAAITVTVFGDTVNEPLETFALQLSNPTGAVVVASQGEASILNDDAGSAWQSDRFPLDVNDDTFVSPLDALQIINELTESGSHPLSPPVPGSEPPPFLDVDGDNTVAPIDALIVINYLDVNGGGPVPSGPMPAPVPLAALADAALLDAALANAALADDWLPLRGRRAAPR